MICGISNDDDTVLAAPLHICFWYIDILCMCNSITLFFLTAWRLIQVHDGLVDKEQYHSSVC